MGPVSPRCFLTSPLPRGSSTALPIGEWNHADATATRSRAKPCRLHVPVQSSALDASRRPVSRRERFAPELELRKSGRMETVTLNSCT
jgi:hypothetical protein